MIVGVLSDTHFPDIETARNLVDRLLSGPFADVQMILHAGDLGPPEALFCFAPLPVAAVRGNTDPAHPDLPERRLLEIEGVRIGLAHGWGASRGLEGRLADSFDESRIDLLVFGHSHLPVYTRADGLLLFNPGSPCRPRSAAGPTVGRLTLANGNIKGEILPFKDMT